MRICVPTTTREGVKAEACEHFGSAPFFTICDTDAGSYEIIENASQHHAHGACHPMEMLEGRKIDVVICAGMGARALQRLNEGGMRIYRTTPGRVEEIVQKFGASQLEEMTYENACGRHQCH